MLADKVRQRRLELNLSQEELARRMGYKSRASINKIEKGRAVTQKIIFRLASALNVSVSYLMGWEDDYAPKVTRDYTSFPIIGDLAAGYDHIAVEDWEGDTIDIPNSYLKGRRKEDFFCLRVIGQSMFPTYQENDIILVLRQSTMNRSGEIGVVMYGDDIATIKKVEFVKGEDWVRLVPINPNFPPQKISGEDLTKCRILGIPKLLIREIE